MIAFTFWVISGPCTGESFVRSNIYIREILEREVYCACMLYMRVTEASVFVLSRVVTLVCSENLPNFPSQLLPHYLVLKNTSF